MTSEEASPISKSYPKGKKNYTVEQRQQKQKERNQRIRAKKNQENQPKSYSAPALTKWNKVEARRELPLLGIDRRAEIIQAHRVGRNERKALRNMPIQYKPTPKIPSWRFFSAHHTCSPLEVAPEGMAEQLAFEHAQRTLPFRERQFMANKKLFTDRRRYVYADLPKRYLPDAAGKLRRVDVPAGKVARNA